MSAPGKAVKLGTAHININTAQTCPSLVLSHKPTMPARHSTYKLTIVRFFLSWPLGAERQTCRVTLIMPHVIN